MGEEFLFVLITITVYDILILEHLCGASFVLSSCGHCYKEGGTSESISMYIIVIIYYNH